jgi:hypothetical protein
MAADQRTDQEGVFPVSADQLPPVPPLTPAVYHHPPVQPPAQPSASHLMENAASSVPDDIDDNIDYTGWRILVINNIIVCTKYHRESRSSLAAAFCTRGGVLSLRCRTRRGIKFSNRESTKIAKVTPAGTLKYKIWMLKNLAILSL